MKYIKMPEHIKKKALEDFETQVEEIRATLKNSNRTTQTLKAEYSPPKNLDIPEAVKKDIKRPHILMSAATYLKMLQYVLKIDVECAWHGFVERYPNNVFTITDVMMYPHEGSSTYVRSDETILKEHTVDTPEGSFKYPEIESYEAWKLNLTAEQESSLRFQAHSHVNMTANPSGTDLNDQKKHMNTLIDYIESRPDLSEEELNEINPFYIFAIMNKKQDITWLLYDYTTGILFEKEDIDFSVVWSNDYNLNTLENEIKNNHKPLHQTRYNASAYGYPQTYNNHYTSSQKYVQQYWDNFQTTAKIDDERIWEVYCPTKHTHDLWKKTKFYKENINDMFGQEDPNKKCWFYYAKNEILDSVIPFEKWVRSGSVPIGVTVKQIEKPKWYPPDEDFLDGPNEAHMHRMDMMFDKIAEYDLRDDGCILIPVGERTELFNKILKKHNNILSSEANFATFRHDLVPGKDIRVYKINDTAFLADPHLECLIALENEGFSIQYWKHSKAKEVRQKE